MVSSRNRWAIAAGALLAVLEFVNTSKGLVPEPQVVRFIVVVAAFSLLIIGTSGLPFGFRIAVGIPAFIVCGLFLFQSGSLYATGESFVCGTRNLLLADAGLRRWEFPRTSCSWLREERIKKEFGDLIFGGFEQAEGECRGSDDWSKASSHPDEQTLTFTIEWDPSSSGAGSGKARRADWSVAAGGGWEISYVVPTPVDEMQVYGGEPAPKSGVPRESWRKSCFSASGGILRVKVCGKPDNKVEEPPVTPFAEHITVVSIRPSERTDCPELREE